MAAVEQHTTQLEFHQAMADFKTMFPDMDDDVIEFNVTKIKYPGVMTVPKSRDIIRLYRNLPTPALHVEAVLRSNQGAVDATIDQLLSMSSDNENEKIFRDDVTDEDIEPTAKHEPDRIERIALRTIHGWDPPLLAPLPHDFLRPSTDVKQAEADLEDERIAMLLQNEEFMAELRWNKDFLSALENESPSEEKIASFRSRMRDDEAFFKERLRNMGKMSRKKFSQLARVFTGRKKRTPTAKAILTEGTTPTRDNLLLREDLETDY